MPINRQRAQEFAREIAALEDGLQFERNYEIFKSKLFDLLARGQIDTETLKTLTAGVQKELNIELVKYIDKVVKDYDEIVKLTNDLYGDIGPEINRELAKLKRVEEINLNQMGEYSDFASKEIAKTIREGIKDNKKIAQIAETLRESEDEKVVSFADTLARTQVKGYGQAGKSEKARLGDVHYFQYTGIIRPTTRLFCETLLRQDNPVFHMQDIARMSNGQLKPVSTYGGGFNCHHFWEPDPFETGEEYRIEFDTIPDGTRSLTIARRR